MIKLVNVSKYYSTNNVIAMGLRRVNLEFGMNEFVAIVGESGSGKTTLLNVICGIDSYEEGEIYINGEETSYFSTAEMENYRKKYVAFVFQNYNLIDSYTVLQNVEAPMILAGYSRKNARKRALELIDRVGMTPHLRHKATKLSGGQKQRVVIARALAKDCPIIAADEPTGNLDSESGRQILELLHEISKNKLVILVTHDYDQVQKYATRKIRIYDGEIVEDLELQKVDKKPLPVILDAEVKVKFFDVVRMAATNLLAVPKKTVLLMVVFLLTTFILAWSYGSFQQRIAIDTNYFEFNPQFLNTGVTRFVVRKTDASAFTPAEIAQLGDTPGAGSLLDHDYILDQTLYGMIPLNEGEGVSLFDYLDFQLAPLSFMNDNAGLLIAGRMPETDLEVVMAIPSENTEIAESYIGKTITPNWYQTAETAPARFSIVGAIQASSLFLDGTETTLYLLFSDAAIEHFQDVIYFDQVTALQFEGTNDSSESVSCPVNFFSGMWGDSNILVDDAVPDDTIIYAGSESGLSYYLCNDLTGMGTCNATGTLKVTDYYLSRDFDNLTIDLDSSETYETGKMVMNTALFNELAYDEIYQVSLFAESDATVSTLRLDLEFFHSLDYVIVYPYEQSGVSSLLDTVSFLLVYILGLLSFLMVFLLSSLVTYLITRLVYNTKLRDFAIFRTIGANQKIIKRFIYLENTMTTVGSFLVFLPVAIYLTLTVQAPDDPLYCFHFYTVVHFLILFAVLMILSLMNSRKYCRRIFKESVQTTLKTQE